MIALFKARVATGCSRLGACAFMTLTYVEGSARLRNADCVKTDWKALFRRFKLVAPDLLELKWLRVMELTKKGTPHHHVVVGTIKQPARCWPRDGFDVRRYRRRMDSCECLAHAFAREWYTVTGDSYIVHGTPVTSAVGAGSYLAKYMTKEFENERASALGMVRRWSSSRGWPGSGRLRLLQTEKGGWDRTSFGYGHWDADLVGGPADLLERTGDVLDRANDAQKARRRLLRTKGVLAPRMED